MTTSLTTSTIPEYRTEDFYYEKQPKPKVNYGGIDNYHKHKGSLNLGDWAEQGKNWDSPRPVPKVKYGAQSNLEKSRDGSMKSFLGGYPDPPHERKGPRVKKEAHQNYLKNKGSVGGICFTNYGKNEQEDSYNPRVYYTGRDNHEKGKGTVSQLFTNYGNLPVSARAIPRVKFEGSDNYEKNKGEAFSKTFQMIPPTPSRPKTAASTTFLW